MQSRPSSSMQCVYMFGDWCLHGHLPEALQPLFLVTSTRATATQHGNVSFRAPALQMQVILVDATPDLSRQLWAIQHNERTGEIGNAFAPLNLTIT